MSSEIEHAETYQLMVKFVTKEKKYSVPDFPYSIQVNSSIETLNALIKSILKDDFKSDEFQSNLETIEFDFYVNGNYLQSTLGELINSNGDIKIESVIEIEYTERNPPPEPVDTVTVDDWVSSIRGFNNYILIGCYDNTVQLWNTDGKPLNSFSGHTGSVKAVCWSQPQDHKSELCFLSASHDQSIIVWNLNKDKNVIIKTHKCVGHTESVECIDVNMENNKFVSGSWDKMLKLWELSEETEIVGESQNKKKKSDANIHLKTPIITLSGHNENISTCCWMDDKTVSTGSWDHSIKIWDVYVGQETRTLKNSSKIFLTIDYSNKNKLIAAGLNDSTVRIYDPRSDEGNLVKISLTSHTGWCSSVFWSKSDENLLVTGSYDNSAKLWDIRNTKSSLYDLLGHEDKVLCVDWSLKNLILTGSADNTFKMYKT